MSLTTTKINSLKQKDKPYKVSDEKGLYLFITKNGSKLWRFDYRYQNKRKTLSFGKYPEISLKDARFKRDEHRNLISSGIDPASAIKKSKEPRDKDTFNYYLWRWFDKHKLIYTSKITEQKNILRIKKYIEPILGSKRIDSITIRDIKLLIDQMIERNVYETAKRMLGIIEKVFNFAMLEESCNHNPAVAFKGYINKPTTINRAFIDDKETFGNLLKDIDNYKGDFLTKAALQLQALVFLRPINLVSAEWSEINFKNKLWVIPAEKMKMRRKHKIPLSKQSLIILKELEKLTGDTPLVFYSNSGASNHLHVETPRRALQKYLGYDGINKIKMTTHGFRHSTATILNNNKKLFNIDSDIIEKQMAHEEKNKVRATYNHAEYLPERIELMQKWADYLDELKSIV